MQTSNEPRLLTPAERQELEAELNRVLNRLSFLLPASKCPAIEFGDGGASRARHQAIESEMRELGKRRDYLGRFLETGINPNFERPVGYKERTET